MDRRGFLQTSAKGIFLATLPSQSLLMAWTPSAGVVEQASPRDALSNAKADIIRFIYPQRPLGLSWPLSVDGVTALYGSYVGGVLGKVQYQDPDAKPPGAYWLAWYREGSVSWNVSAPESVECALSLCYASSLPGMDVTVSIGDQNVKEVAPKTAGYWPDDPNAPMNFERVPLHRTIRLSKGENIVRLEISNFNGAIRVRSLELVPVPATVRLQQDAERARSNRANTDWFVRAGYGLFNHWTSQVPPLRGERKPYAEAVKDFDVQKYVSMVAETGAGYLIFTANHAEPTFPAPLKVWEHYHPGWTTERDLIRELADELAKHNIRLVVYLASEILGGVRASNGVSKLISTPEYQTALEEILGEIGNRYGDSIAGYWFDHASWSKENFQNLSFERLWHAVKAGNSSRLVAYNFWQFPIMTEWQDYWADEGAINKPPAGRYMTVGPAKGLQYHNSVPIDGAYIHLKPNSDMEGPIYKDEQLIEFIKACIAKQGVVSLGAGISQDLQMSEAILRQLSAVRKAIRGS